MEQITMKLPLPRCASVVVALVLSCAITAQAALTTYQKDVTKEIKDGANTVSIVQKRWYLENDKVRLGVTDDPGGAIVEFTNKETGVNHVADRNYSYTVDGKTKKYIYYN